MKVKLDENIPVRLAGLLATFGHAVDTVASEGLKGRSDSDVWSAAQREDRFLITQDLDFSDVRQFKPGTHAGLLLVRLREPGANALVSRIQAAVQRGPRIIRPLLRSAHRSKATRQTLVIETASRQTRREADPDDGCRSGTSSPKAPPPAAAIRASPGARGMMILPLR